MEAFNLPLLKLSPWHVETGARIRAARHNANLTLQDVADRLGISWQIYQRYELATGRLSADVLFLLAEIFDVNATQLISPRRPTIPVRSR